MCFGAQIHGFIGALVAAVTSASPAFTKLQIAENALTLHYVIILHVCCNRARFSDEYASFTLAIQTVHNLSTLAAHAIASCSTSLEPRLLQELPIEKHFARIKQHCPGSPGIKDGLYGMAIEAARQDRLLRGVDPASLNIPAGHMSAGMYMGTWSVLQPKP